MNAPSRRAWTVARTAAGGLVLLFVLWQVGTGQVLQGVRRVGPDTVALAVVLAGATTWCAAWRWTAVARDLGLDLPLRTAFVSYYRSQLLNSSLPGGVVGDVHRGVRHGRAADDLGLGLRSVVWERGAGQGVQVVVVVAVLVAVRSPLGSDVLPVLLAVVGALLVLAWAVPVLRPGWAPDGAGRHAIRPGVLAPRTWLVVVLCSVLATTGHAATFLLAAHAVGEAPLPVLLPLALVVLLGMSVPANLAGWGPREGVAAWAFASVGLGAAQGVAAAVVYGLLSFVAVLPGAAVLVADWVSGRRGARPAAVVAGGDA